METYKKYLGIDALGRIATTLDAMLLPGMLNVVSPGGIRYVEAVDGVDKDTHWYNTATSEFELLQDNPSTISGTTINNAPAPCVVVINKNRYPCPDPTCEIDGLEAGTHTLRVEAKGYKDAVFEVVV